MTDISFPQWRRDHMFAMVRRVLELEDYFYTNTHKDASGYRREHLRDERRLMLATYNASLTPMERKEWTVGLRDMHAFCMANADWYRKITLKENVPDSNETGDEQGARTPYKD